MVTVFLMVCLIVYFGVADVLFRGLKNRLDACRFRLWPCRMRNMHRVERVDSDRVLLHRNGV